MSGAENDMVDLATDAIMAAFKDQMGGKQIPGVPIDSWAAKGNVSVDLTIVARAAITAMRDPTTDMLTLGLRYLNMPATGPNVDILRSAFNAMIDKALS